MLEVVLEFWKLAFDPTLLVSNLQGQCIDVICECLAEFFSRLYSEVSSPDTVWGNYFMKPQRRT
jgi:hypothetical protein